MNNAANELIQAFVDEYRLSLKTNGSVLDTLARSSSGFAIDGHAAESLRRMFLTIRDAALFLEFPTLAAIARAMTEVLPLLEPVISKQQLTEIQIRVLTQGIRLVERIVQGVAAEGREPRVIPDLAPMVDAVRAAGLQWQQGEPVVATAAPSVLSDAQKLEHLLGEEPIKPAPLPAPRQGQPSRGVTAAPDMVAIFVQDAVEILDHAEQQLMQLEANPALIHDLLRGFHTLKGNSGLMGYDDLQTLSHRLESVLQQIRDCQGALPANGIRLFLGTIDVVRRCVASVSRGGSAAIPDCADRLRQLDSLMNLEVQSAFPAEKTAGTAEKTESPATEALGVAGRGGLRVSVERLDQLNELTSELVIASAVVAHVSDCRHGIDFERFNRAFYQLNLLASGLQDLAIAMRMVPVELAFRRLPRLVRDLSEKTGKPVDLQVAGSETEVDRRVTELIADPLIHILRNAMDHGIESPEERHRRGKPRTGTIRVEALHRADEVWIMISDDGGGFNRQKILERGRAMGLIGLTESPRDDEIFGLVFQPGFSTAEQVSEVSGRGVGLDVVRKNIERLRGRVEIQSSEGLGSTMTIRLPLTLAVIHGMLVRVGAEEFALPVQAIRESLRPSAEDLHRMTDRHGVINVRGEIMPLFSLAELLAIKGDACRPEAAIVTIVEDGERRAALWLDEIVGQQRVVVKSLGESVGHIAGISGASILADGKVRLILDVPGLIRMAHERAG